MAAASQAARRGVLGGDPVLVVVLVLGVLLLVPDGAASAAPSAPSAASAPRKMYRETGKATVGATARAVATIKVSKPLPAQATSRVRAKARASATATAKSTTRARAKQIATKTARARAHTKAVKIAKARAASAARSRAKAGALRQARWKAWRPQDHTWFNYPKSKYLSERMGIRRPIRAMIQHVPAGGQIRLATFSFDDALISQDLVAAHRRGVRVEVLVAWKNRQLPAFRTLKRGLKSKRSAGAPAQSYSFAKACYKSCRGKNGLLHTKMYLFSRAGQTKYVSMIGSANLTRFAAVGQWNHMNTIVEQSSYEHYYAIFAQMARDARAKPVSFRTKKTAVVAYPRGKQPILKDADARAINQVSCRYKRQGKLYRSRILIGMYSWFDTRGNNLAKVVRRKWDQGCQVAVLYSVTNSTVPRILRARTGRGPIPTKKTGQFAADGTALLYNHSKYIAVRGLYAGHVGYNVWTGSMNFTLLGVASDELIVRLHGRSIYNAYETNFRRIYHSRWSHR